MSLFPWFFSRGTYRLALTQVITPEARESLVSDVGLVSNNANEVLSQEMTSPPQPQLLLWWPLLSFCFPPHKSPSLASCPLLELCPQLTSALVPDSSVTSSAEAPPWSLKKKNDNPEKSLQSTKNMFCNSYLISVHMILTIDMGGFQPGKSLRGQKGVDGELWYQA